MPFHYTLKEIPSGDEGTFATVREIIALIKEGKQNPRVRTIATRVVAGLPWKNHEVEAGAIFSWIKQNIRFVNDPDGSEMLQDVEAILNYKSADCDDLTILGASLLGCIGIPSRIVVIAGDPRAPQAFSHIYLQAWCKTKWVGFDTSVVGSTIGWEPPTFTRKKIIEIA